MGVNCSKIAFAGVVLALALIVGCHKRDTEIGTVIAKIGTEKITETQFVELMNELFGDPEQAKDFLTNESKRGQRNEFLAKYLESKALVMLAKDEGLDKDLKIQLQLDEAITQVYAGALLERRLPDIEPTDEQLRGIYDEIAIRQKAAGATIPPFAEAKPHLPQLWKQKQQQEAAESLMKEIKTKYPATIADDYIALNRDM